MKEKSNDQLPSRKLLTTELWPLMKCKKFSCEGKNHEENGKRKMLETTGEIEHHKSYFTVL